MLHSFPRALPFLNPSKTFGRLIHTRKRVDPTMISDQISLADFFRFTRGRFLSDEPHHISQTTVKFKLDELERLAVDSAATHSKGPLECVKIEKLPDGMHNKAIRFTMNNGVQVVGKIPNPNAGKAHFTTASEVATMDFLRNVLKIPIPHVLAWSSTSKNDVGAEYILMENVPGVPLSKLWDQLEVGAKFRIVQSIATYQEMWLNISFSHYGSL
ncbi:hypothetical protein BO82DRAFT_411202, partial [Aspergillus uvarum CBS 121591]